MAKRIADKELTDRNWDQEEEGEEAGTFSVASEDVLKHRAIKKAKRRNVGSEAEVSGTFKGFKSFTLTSGSGGSAPTAFSGLGNGFKGLGGLTNGSGGALSFGGFSSSSAAATAVTFNGPSSSPKAAGSSGAQQTNGSAPAASGSGNKEYGRQLTALNCSVRDWITKHVNDNPLCDLNPIFRDYERHLASIERQYGAGSTDAASAEKKPSSAPPPPSRSDSSAPPAAPAPFSLGKVAAAAAEDSPAGGKSGGAPRPADVTFNFGQKVDAAALGFLGSKSTAPSFSFSSSQSSLFGAPAMTFGATKSEEAPSAELNADEDAEEPPKPDVKEVKEDDAFFSKKCKLFYKKEAEFKEKGVGTLHLKQTAEGKTQMVIRADTNLGNILLNILLQASLPCSRVGKNNVMVVCVPNPPVDDKNPASPVPLLIRVKTAEDADELHKLLEEKKG